MKLQHISTLTAATVAIVLLIGSCTPAQGAARPSGGVTRAAASTVLAPAAAAQPSRITASLRLRTLPRGSQRVVVRLKSRKSGHARYTARLTIKRSGTVRLRYLRHTRTGKARTLGRSRTILKQISPDAPYTIEYRTTGRKRVTLSTRMWRSTDTPSPRWVKRHDRGRARLRTPGRVAASVWASPGMAKPVLVVGATGDPAPTPTPDPTPAPEPPASDARWVPAKGTSWQWQLTGNVDTSVDAAVFDIDGEEASPALVSTLHAKGAKVICYFSAGSWEDWRSDGSAFPASVKGKTLDGWPDEKWLDVRQLDVLLPIMEARIADCAAKGFDAVEPDNVDAYTNSTGFPLTAADQIAYNKALANLAHKHGLGVALKNDAEQVKALEPYFDFSVAEECARYNECDMYAPFTNAGKAVLHVEYRGTLDSFCPTTKALGFSSMLKKLDLTAWREVCA